MKNFWNWFTNNHQNLKNPTTKKVAVFWLEKNLNYFCLEIGFLIVFPKEKQSNKGIAELIITANGNPDYFKQVINLIDTAPKIDGWKFTAFIQPTAEIDKIIDSLDEPYIIQELTLKTSKLKFLPINYDENTQKYDIKIYLEKHHLHCDTKTLKQAIFIIMQDLLGEKSLFQNINFVQLAQLPYDNKNLIYLYDLQLLIDNCIT